MKTRTMHARRDPILLAIAAFKYVKAMMLIGAGVAALRLIDSTRATRLQEWLADLHLATLRSVTVRAISLINHTTADKLELVGAIAFAYAALFLTEGTGLFLARRWAEYLTIVATASLIPFEIWETVHRLTPMKIVTMAINVAVVLYLVWKVRTRHSPES